MLKTAEERIFPPRNIGSTTHVLAIMEDGVKRNKYFHPHPKGKGKGKVCNPHSNPKKDVSDIAPVNNPKEAISYYCQEKCHWKHSFPMYFEDLKKNKAKGIRTSGMFTTELHLDSTFIN